VRWLKFDLEGPGIELWLGAEGARPIVRAEPDENTPEPDAVITGAPSALLAMALPDADGGAIRIEGDARLVQKFQQAVKALDPDLEQALTGYFGELLGPQIHRRVAGMVRAGSETARAGGGQISRWLREESGLTPAPGEWRRFRDDVDRLREAVDRLDGRIRRTRG